MAAGHVGSGPGLIDGHETLRLQIVLALEPFMRLLQEIGSVLLDGMANLSLRVMLRRTQKNRCSSATETTKRLFAKARRSSSSEISLRNSQSPRMAPARPSIRRDRMSSPFDLGAKLPVAHRRPKQWIAVDGAMPNQTAAARQLNPSSVWILNYKSATLGLLFWFISIKKRSNGNEAGVRRLEVAWYPVRRAGRYTSPTWRVAGESGLEQGVGRTPPNSAADCRLTGLSSAVSLPSC